MKRNEIGKVKLREFDKSLSRAHKINSKIFGSKFDKFEFVVCNSLQEFMKKSKSVSEKFTAIAYKDEKIFIKSRDIILKEGRFKKKEIPGLITHEINHMYWYHFKKTWSPYWLCEGLASYAGHNFRSTKVRLKELARIYNISGILDFRYISKHFRNGHEPRYHIWADFTRYLIRIYGLRKVVKVCMQNTKTGYSRTFEGTFGMTEKELYKRYLDGIR